MTRLLEFLRLLNLPCRDITALVSRSLDEELSFGERFAARLHVLYCSACRRYRRQLRLLHELLGRAGDGGRDAVSVPLPGLPDEARQRLRRLLRSR